MKPYYQDEFVTLLHGDSADLITKVSASIVVTDPPYGVNKRPRTYQAKSGPPATWDSDFMLPVLTSDTDVLCVLPGVSNLTRLPEVISELRYVWTLSVWISNGMTRSPFGYGNWIPGLVYARDGVKLYQQKSDFAKVSVSGRKPDHPSPKPISAMLHFVSRMPDGVICDPYAGSGSTLLAAKMLGRKSIGIEIDERSCEVAAKRLLDLRP